MRGYQVHRKGGWDCHGLPVELAVEQELGFSSKEDIERYGVAEFNARCRESVMRYIDDWNRLTERIGHWIDTDDAYVTLDNDYIESVWWSLRQVFDQGLLTEGHKVVPYCTRCGTALSSHEVALGYREVVDPSVYVKFRCAMTRASRCWPGRPCRGHWCRTRRSRSIRRSYAREARRRPAHPGRVAGRAGARRGRRDRGADARLGAPRVALRAALPLHRRLRRARPHRAGGRFRLHRGRHRRGPHRRGVRRGRLPPGHRQRPHDPQPGTRRRHVRRADGTVRGHVRARRRRSDHRGAARVRPALPRRRVRALLSALLALRHPADLLRQAQLVRAHHRAPRGAAGRERGGLVVPGPHQARPLRQVAREQRGLGSLARTLLGNAAAGLARGRRRGGLRGLSGRAA